MPGSPVATHDSDPPDVAGQVFGTFLPLARRYAELLSTHGIEHGLLGPREAERIWDRHLLNCAVLTELIPDGARVVDVGSGAGLPGVVLAIRRPDLRVDLVESLRRRCEFLDATVAALGLQDRVRVVRGRAEDPGVITQVGSAHWVTGRAVAPLDRLVRWCLPLLVPGGVLLAIKGRSAGAELTEHGDVIKRVGGRNARLVRCKVPGSTEDVSVIAVRRAVPRGKKGST